MKDILRGFKAKLQHGPKICFVLFQLHATPKQTECHLNFEKNILTFFTLHVAGKVRFGSFNVLATALLDVFFLVSVLESNSKERSSFLLRLILQVNSWQNYLALI